VAKRTIANLNIKLSAHTASLQRDFDGAVGHVRKFGVRVKAVAIGVAKAFAAVAGVAAGLAVSLAAATKPQWDAIAALGKLSVQTGAAVDELSRMQYAADKLNIDRDDLTGAIEELNIRLGETIRDGIGPAAEALRQLNLDGRKLADMPLTERLATIGEALAGIKNQATRGFLADEIFGGDAFKILPLLRQGADGIRSLANESDQLGNTVSQIDVDKVLQANAAIRQTRTLLNGLLRRVAVAAAPIVTVLAERLLEVGTEGGAAADMITRGMDMVTNVIAGVMNAVQKLRSGFRFLAAGVQALAAISSSVRDVMIGAFREAFDRIINMVQDTLDLIRPMAAKIGWAGEIDETSAAMRRVSQKAGVMAAAHKAFTDQLWKSSGENFEKAKELWKSRPGDKFLADVKRAIERAKEAVDDLKPHPEPTPPVTKTPGTAALQVGTTQGVSAVSAALRQARQQQMLQQKIHREQVRANAHLAAIAANTKEPVKVTTHRI